MFCPYSQNVVNFLNLLMNWSNDHLQIMIQKISCCSSSKRCSKHLIFVWSLSNRMLSIQSFSSLWTTIATVIGSLVTQNDLDGGSFSDTAITGFVHYDLWFTKILHALYSSSILKNKLYKNSKAEIKKAWLECLKWKIKMCQVSLGSLHFYQLL